MKAETLKQFLLKKYPTNEYFDCPVPKHHWEVIQEYAEHYARIQIDKDRKAVIENAPLHKRLDIIYAQHNTPINLES